jgi:hypothetical protein
VMTRASLHPMLRARIEAEAQRVFLRATQHPSATVRHSRRDQRNSGRSRRSHL